MKLCYVPHFTEEKFSNFSQITQLVNYGALDFHLEHWFQRCTKGKVEYNEKPRYSDQKVSQGKYIFFIEEGETSYNPEWPIKTN